MLPCSMCDRISLAKVALRMDSPWPVQDTAPMRLSAYPPQPGLHKRHTEKNENEIWANICQCPCWCLWSQAVAPMMGESPTLPTILFLIPPVEVAQATLPTESTATAPTVSWALWEEDHNQPQFVMTDWRLYLSTYVSPEWIQILTIESWNFPSRLCCSSCVSATLLSPLQSPASQWGRWPCQCSPQTGWHLCPSTANGESGIFSGIKRIFDQQISLWWWNKCRGFNSSTFSITARARETGQGMFLTDDTAPLLSVRPSMMIASSSTSPSAFSTAPWPKIQRQNQSLNVIRPVSITQRNVLQSVLFVTICCTESEMSNGSTGPILFCVIYFPFLN